MKTELEENEIRHNFLSFCSFLCMLHGKKINLPNIFILTLLNSYYKNIFKHVLCIESDQELVSYFTAFDASLAKSKYVSKFLNSKEAYDKKIVKVPRGSIKFKKTSGKKGRKRLK